MFVKELLVIKRERSTFMKKNRNHIVMIGLLTVVAIACTLMFQGKPAAAKAKLSVKKAYLAPKDTLKLKVKGTKKKVKWVSSNKKVCTVSKKGKVKAKKTGKATIVAKINGKKFKCKIIVEKKNINRARRLRDYVIKKGKYNKSEKAYELKWFVMDTSNNCQDAMISAYKGKYDLQFYYHRDAESSYRYDTIMTINLITGVTSIKKGTAKLYSDEDVDDEYDETTYYGEITTAFDGKGNGLTLTKKTWTEEDGGKEVLKETEEASVLTGAKAGCVSRFTEAFKRWDVLFSKKYPALKKSGISMKSIGFSKWK